MRLKLTLMSHSPISVNILVLLPAAALCLALVFHSVRKRGVLDTLVFVAAGLPFFWLRELWAMNENMYAFQKGAVTILHVRVVGIVGWFFTSYCSLALAEDIISRICPRRANTVFATTALAAFVTMAIADVMETAGQNMGFWTARQEGKVAFPLILHGAQWFTPAWISTVALFLMPYLLTCAIFKTAPGLAARRRVPLQLAANIVMLMALAVICVIVVGPLATFLLPFSSIILALIPLTSRLRYR